MDRPHSYINIKGKETFVKPPFKAKPFKFIKPPLVFPIPLMSGHICYLQLPCDYNIYDINIVQATLEARFKYTKEAKEAFEKSPLGEYINRHHKNKSIVTLHY